MKSRSNYFFLNILVLIICLFCNLGIRAQDEDDDEGGEEATPKGFITLVYVEWASEVASTFVMKAVLEEMGHEVDTLSVSAAFMWQAIASGDADGMVAAWLPSTHEHYYNAVKDEIDDLGPNLKGTRIGLVVPRYVTINSITELNATADQFGHRIIGIDPGAGLMSKTELAMKEYDLSAFKLIEGSGATMVGALADALREKKWLVVTGWTPHWKFARWELKYLEDPKNIYGKEEQIHTIVRQGLKEDLPDVYKVMDNFFWTAADMEKVMIWNSEPNASPEENAKRWVKENHDKVEQWKK